MIRGLDARLVAAAQWVVDLTQRQPHTLGGLSVALSAVLCFARAGLVALPGWVVGLALLSYALVFSLSLSPALFRFLDYRPIRILQLVSVALDLVVLLAVAAAPPLCSAAGAGCSVSQTGYGLSLLQSLASLACWCFAACRPPRPRAPRPRGRLALGGAA
jgi:hypothetical protein